MRARGFGTKAVRGRRGASVGPLATPIVQASTFAFANSGEMERYNRGGSGLHLYTRYENPTLQELQDSLAALEEAEAGLVFASGMAASTTGILSLIEPGDEVLASASLYGGTTRFVRDTLPRWGFPTRIVPPGDLHRPEVYSPRTALVVFESPTNPSLDVLDIPAILGTAHAAGAKALIDNTFAGPVLQRPVPLGADLVMESLTKSLAGHSDVMGGALVGSREVIGRAWEVLKVMGGCMDPHAAFLVLRGLKTVHLRVARQCDNALALARHLETHPKIARVLYPGLASHPGHETARRQMSAFGGVCSFVLRGGLPAAERFYDALDLVARAASLGGVESVLSLPVHTSHHGYTEEQLRVAGVDPGAVRLSCGVEETGDLIEDVDHALVAC
jgi:cystathionine beta-lyase/cystathionine gamma-synthase